MTQYRTIKRIISGQPTMDGAGVHLVRLVGYGDVEDFDPFLLLDAFDSTDEKEYIKGFPWHPHRGIETVTYLIHGDIEHGDSLGNRGSILDGDCQWMTAGSGIIHQEMPQPSPRMLGCQLWINLPKKDKMVQPVYRDIVNEHIPVVLEGDARIKIVAGVLNATRGAMQGDFVKPLYLDVSVEIEGTWSFETKKEHTLFIYIFEGSGSFGDSNEVIEKHHVVLFDQAETFFVQAKEKGIRFLLLQGEPLKEPIAWGGPIVMNTKQELQQAFRELDDGTFIQ